MNPCLIAGTAVVFLALSSYSAAVVNLTRSRRATDAVMLFLALGVSLDATATACMIFGSRNIPLTLHGIMGYSALILMAADMMLLRRIRKMHGPAEPVPDRLMGFSMAAYAWWVVVFIAGAIMASHFM